jgi:hypothetical protein
MLAIKYAPKSLALQLTSIRDFHPQDSTQIKFLCQWLLCLGSWALYTATAWTIDCTVVWTRVLCPGNFLLETRAEALTHELSFSLKFTCISDPTAHWEWGGKYQFSFSSKNTVCHKGVSPDFPKQPEDSVDSHFHEGECTIGRIELIGLSSEVMRQFLHW